MAGTVRCWKYRDELRHNAGPQNVERENGEIKHDGCDVSARSKEQQGRKARAVGIGKE